MERTTILALESRFRCGVASYRGRRVSGSDEPGGETRVGPDHPLGPLGMAKTYVTTIGGGNPVAHCTQAGIISKAEQALAERGKPDARPHGVARQPQSRQVNARPLAAPLNR